MNDNKKKQLIAWLESMPWWKELPYAKLKEETAALKRENDRLEDGRDRWHQRWGIAFDILDTTQRRQYEEELALLADTQE